MKLNCSRGNDFRSVVAIEVVSVGGDRISDQPRPGCGLALRMGSKRQSTLQSPFKLQN